MSSDAKLIIALLVFAIVAVMVFMYFSGSMPSQSPAANFEPTPVISPPQTVRAVILRK